MTKRWWQSRRFTIARRQVTLHDGATLFLRVKRKGPGGMDGHDQISVESGRQGRSMQVLFQASDPGVLDAVSELAKAGAEALRLDPDEYTRAYRAQFEEATPS